MRAYACLFPRTNMSKSAIKASFSMPDLVASQRKNLYTVRLPAFVIFPSFPVLPFPSAGRGRSAPLPRPRMPCEATFVRSIIPSFSFSVSPPPPAEPPPPAFGSLGSSTTSSERVNAMEIDLRQDQRESEREREREVMGRRERRRRRNGGRGKKRFYILTQKQETGRLVIFMRSFRHRSICFPRAAKSGECCLRRRMRSPSRRSCSTRDRKSSTCGHRE